MAPSVKERPRPAPGLCRCGCGERTPIATRNRHDLGHVKGEPIPFISGHNSWKRKLPADLTQTKLCECGCGDPAPIATTSRSDVGRYRGFPMRFIPGHRGRRRGLIESFHEEDRGYDTPCWIWDLYIDHSGYGATGQQKAHRAVYEERVGPIPEGLQLDHLCRVRECVNPEHLEPVTLLENVRRSARAKLTVESAAEIKRGLSRGVPRRVLAKRFGVTTGSISNIARGRTWRDV